MTLSQNPPASLMHTRRVLKIVQDHSNEPLLQNVPAMAQEGNMSNFPSLYNRRRILKIGLAGIAVVPVLGRFASAQESQVDENDTLAQQLHYKHDATQAQDPKYQSGQLCETCQLYQGQAGEEWGPCPLFQNKLVNAKGWCNAWVPKSG